MIVDKRSTQIWAFLFPVIGPLFCFMAFFIAMEKTFTLDLWLFSLIVSFLLFRERRQGFALSLIGLSLIAVVRLALSKDIFWEFGLDCSLMLALYLTYEGISFADRFVHSIRQEKEDATSKLDHLLCEMKEEKERFLLQQEKYQDRVTSYDNEIVKLQEKLHSLSALCTTLTHSIDLSTEFRDNLEKKSRTATFALTLERKKNQYLLEKLSSYPSVESLEKQCEELKKEKLRKEYEIKEQESLKERYFSQYRVLLLQEEKRRSDLEKLVKEHQDKVAQLEEDLRMWKAKAKSIKEVKVEPENTQEKNVALATMQAKLKEITTRYEKSKKLLDGYVRQVKELLHTRAAYHQLRKQFKEKNLLLHATRKELFSLQTEIEKREKDQFEKELEERSLSFEDFEEENERLIDLVSTLLPKVEIKAYQEELF